MRSRIQQHTRSAVLIWRNFGKLYSVPLHQSRYPGHRSRDPPSVILGEPLQDALPDRFILEIEVGEALPEAVSDDVGFLMLFDLPRRRKSARIGHDGSRTQQEQTFKVDIVHKLI